MAKTCIQHTGRFTGVWSRITISTAVFLLFARLAAEPDLSISAALLVGVTAIIVILLALTQYLSHQGISPWSPIFIIGIALLIRLLFIWNLPVLSDDLYRYLFDGLMVLRGTNPYGAAPDAAVCLTREMADLIPLINHANLVTIYPPAAQMVFAGGAAMGKLAAPLAGMKLILSAMDIGSCILMLLLVKQLGLPSSRVILYAWNPLPVLEIAGSGHIDGGAAFFLLAALTLAIRPGKGIATGFFMALAILTKWVPLMALPFWFLLVPRTRRIQALVALCVTGSLLTSLFWPELLNSVATLGQYLRHWEFSGLMFRELRHFTGSGEISRIITMVLFAGITAILFLKQLRRPSEPGTAFGSLAAMGAAYLVLSPTAYPWYALYLAIFLPFIRHPAGLIFTWSVMLSYRILMVRNLTGLWLEDDLIPVMIVAAPMAAMICHALVKAFTVTRPGDIPCTGTL